MRKGFCPPTPPLCCPSPTVPVGPPHPDNPTRTEWEGTTGIYMAGIAVPQVRSPRQLVGDGTVTGHQSQGAGPSESSTGLSPLDLGDTRSVPKPPKAAFAFNPAHFAEADQAEARAVAHVASAVPSVPLVTGGHVSRTLRNPLAERPASVKG